jgi:hypothetical protein
MDELNLTDLAATIADRLCGAHEHVCSESLYFTENVDQ